MPYCSVLECKNDSRKNNILKGGISYHLFPKDGHLKEKWINATGRQNWFPTKRSTICSAHFHKNDFVIKKGGKRYIVDTAIPSTNIFLYQTLSETVLVQQHDDQHPKSTVSEANEVIANVTTEPTVAKYYNTVSPSLFRTADGEEGEKPPIKTSYPLSQGLLNSYYIFSSEDIEASSTIHKIKTEDEQEIKQESAGIEDFMFNAAVIDNYQAVYVYSSEDIKASSTINKIKTEEEQEIKQESADLENFSFAVAVIDNDQAGPSTSNDKGDGEKDAKKAPASPLERPIATCTLPRTPQSSSSASHDVPQLHSPANFMDIGQNSPQVASCDAKPSSVSVGRKRKLVPALADTVNHGSDQDDDEDEDEDDDSGFLRCPRSERIFDLSNEITAPMDCTLLSDSTNQPSSSADSTGPPAFTSSICADPAQPSISASVSDKATYGPHSLDEFVWDSLPIPAIPPQERREKFTASVGPVSTFATPYEAFVSIWNRSIMEYIAAETNRYAEQTLETALSNGDLGGYSRKLPFTATDADELYVFFSLLLATGVVFKADLTEYWSVNDDVFDTPNFGRYMTYTRFVTIARMLHFINNEIGISHLSKSDAKIAKIAPIVKHLNEKFHALYQLGRCVALDDSLTPWKGSLSRNQWVKSKAAERGIKMYEVCDSNSGYLWRFKVHAGCDEEQLEHIISRTRVLELLKGLENKGHTIFMDHYYNSPILARILKSQGFDCAGTLRLNRQHVPANLKALVKQPLNVGSVHGATSGDVDILFWKDRNVVSLVSTYHGAASASRDKKAKPTLVHDYDVRMGNVDKKNQMLSAYSFERKRTAVWYKKLFRRLLNVSVLNAYILHKESPAVSHPHLTEHRQFRKNLVSEILAKHGQRQLVTLHSSSKVKFSMEMVHHFPKEFPYDEKWKQRKRDSCGVCHKSTQFQCIGCNIALCVDTCFVKYHS